MNQQRLVDRFLKYIGCASESREERTFCEMVEQELLALGLEVKRGEVGDQFGSNGFNLYAFLPGEGEPILFSSHMDTVTPGKGIKPVIEDGVIRSSGDTILASDDKSGIAAILEAVETIKEENLSHRPIEIMFTICEELGMLGAKAADYGLFSSKQAVVLDTGAPGGIVNRAPANVVLHIEIKGKSAHAGIAPEKGIHALKAAADAIANIPCGHVDDLTVMNVANLLSPGKTNIVPEQTAFDMEIRSFEEEVVQKHLRETEQAVKAACEKYGATYTIEMERHSDVLYVPEDSKLVRNLLAQYQALGLEGCCKSTYGGSDATWLFANGLDAVNIGTGMTNAHSVSEYILIEDMVNVCKVAQGMMTSC